MPKKDLSSILVPSEAKIVPVQEQRKNLAGAGQSVSFANQQATLAPYLQQRRVSLRLNSVRDLFNVRMAGKPNVFALLTLGTTRHKTTTVKGTDAKWDEEFTFELLNDSVVTMTFYHYGNLHDHYIGETEIDLEEAPSQSYTIDLPIQRRKWGKTPKPAGSCCISVELAGFGDANKRQRMQSNMQYIAEEMPYNPMEEIWEGEWDENWDQDQNYDVQHYDAANWEGGWETTAAETWRENQV